MPTITLFSEPFEKPSQNYGSFGPWIQIGCWVRKSAKNGPMCIVAEYHQKKSGYSVNLPWSADDGDDGIHLTTKTAEDGKQFVDALIKMFGWE